MSIIKDIISDQSLKRGSEGYEAERVYIVESAGTPEARLYSAITTAGIPQFGDPHPVIPDVQVNDITASPVTGATPNLVKVRVNYAGPSPEDLIAAGETDVSSGEISFNTSLASELTYRDINGQFIIVEWRGGTISTKYAGIEVQRPQLSVRLKRTESALPKSVIENFLGKVNSTSWAGFPPKTWLCTAVDVNEESAGKFVVDYGFSYKADDWRVEVTVGLTQAQIDELPLDVDSGNGFGIFDVYKTADFNALGLSF